MNRELAYMRADFYLGKSRTPAKVFTVPKFDMVSERNNVRTGFLTDAEYHILLSELPDYLKPLFVVAVNVAIRRGELLKIQWSQVNFEESVITLNPWETKKQDIRNCPIVKGDMLDYLRVAEKNRDCKWVFSRNGEVITDFKNAWERACNRAAKREGGEDLGNLRFHDLRRTAVRNMRRAGVPMTVIMKISGHKTEAMHIRYNIVDLDDIQEAGRLMAVRQNANAGAEMTSGAADLAARILALPEDKRKLLAALL